jgi:hypothetical protein
MTTFSTYVVMHRNRYCRFGSYSSVTFTENPLSATHYARERDAWNRVSGGHYDYTSKKPGVTYPYIPSTDFKVVRITLQLIEQKPIRKGHR